MDNAFDQVFDILNFNSEASEASEASGDDESDSIVSDDDIIGPYAEAIAEINRVDLPVPDRLPMDRAGGLVNLIEIVEYDPSNNILDEEIRAEFEAECIYEETHLFSRPTSTTNTVEGFLSNVSFTEEEFIHHLIPCEDIVMYRCNFGKLKYEHYNEVVKVKRTNRGRKKKPKKKKNRKKQGTGDDFNSQITFVVRSRLCQTKTNDDGAQIVPYGAKVYKFKIFRTGKLQLPGVHPTLIDDVIACAEKIVDMLNFTLHTREANLARLTKLININPVMKNYKFIIKVPPQHIIDLDVLRRILQRHLFLQRNPVDGPDQAPPPHPAIFQLKYTRQDTKLSIKFATPIYRKPKKRTRINIFMRGKVNILGGFDAEVTRQICDYLHWIFEKNYNQLIVSEGYIEPPLILAENIAQGNDLTDLYKHFTTHIDNLPQMSEQDCDDIMEFIDCAYDEIMSEAKECFDDFCKDLMNDPKFWETGPINHNNSPTIEAF